ncbi:MAG TPA: OmpA family protein [Bacteroidales bacterium]|jgi:outer membrane protein OmpA-like peptidoglycan-associated protein|nr:OmpA family protein [Bacteroidales bacterium]
MKKFRNVFIVILGAVILSSGCASMKKSTKGAAIGTAAGGAMGAVIGRASGNAGLGAIIGATVGGATGAVIGRQMDKQAADIKNTVPDAKVERVGEGIVVEFSSNVLFDFDKSDLTANAQPTLNKLVDILDKYPDTNIELQGHTDDTGPEKYNQALSERRARAVDNYLTKKDISGKRINIKGFGESIPKYDNATADGRAKNRRVEFLITANEKMVADARKQAEGK